MKVLVLNQHYWPEIAPTGQLLQDICEDLANSGHSVSVICGRPSYRLLPGMENAPASEFHNGVKILRVPSYVPTKRSIPRRMLHYGTYFGASLLSTLTTERPDVVLIMSTPPLLLGVTGVLIRALRDVPFVYSVQDLYPDVAINLGVVRKGRFTDAIDKISSTLYRAATGTVTLSQGMAQRLIDKGVQPDQLRVIPNWADTTNAPIERNNPFAVANGLADRFVVQYSGNVGLSQGLDHLVAAAAMVTDLPITFAIVGDGNAKESLQRQAKNLNCSNIIFLPPQPRELLPQLLASCDVGLVCMKWGVGNDLVPSKLYGILASARPVLASVETTSEVARVLEHFACGEVVTPENPPALAEGVRKLFANQERLAVLGMAGRQACEEHFSRSVCTSRYRDVLLAAAGRDLRMAVAPMEHVNALEPLESEKAPKKWPEPCSQTAGVS